ncbi:MAG: molybdopterin converting factor subunit 1 [Azonexus sp.]|jgi:molybdopterin synthase sulfur carrier subunit|nr:molybdopterin converting factor subunit 1 [Azonexus sp.]
MSASIRVNVLYFAGLRETFGLPGETIELPAEVQTVGALRDHLIAQGRAALASTKNLRCAVNQEMANASTPIQNGDEIAFFPPVTGG